MNRMIRIGVGKTNSSTVLIARNSDVCSNLYTFTVQPKKTIFGSLAARSLNVDMESVAASKELIQWCLLSNHAPIIEILFRNYQLTNFELSKRQTAPRAFIVDAAKERQLLDRKV